MSETKTLGDIVRDQEYAAAREFIRRKYPLTELGATALMEFSLERNEYFRKIAEQAQQIVTAVVNTTVMPPMIVPTFPRSSQNQTVASGVEGAHEGTTADKSVALAESSLSSPPPNFWKWYGMLSLLYHRAGITTWGSIGMATEQECHQVIGEFERFCKQQPTFRQSSSPAEPGAESVHSGKLNTADKSELLPTQLPKEK